MKKIMELKLFVAIAMLCLITKTAFAQAVEEIDNKWGCSIAINSVEAQVGPPLQSSWGDANSNLKSNGDKTDKSYSLSIIPKYFLSNDVALRFEFGITNLQITENQSLNNVGGLTIFNQSMNQKIYRYNLGIQRSFIKKKHIDFFCGATISYIKYNSMNYDSYNENRQAPTNIIDFWQNINVTYTGGYSSGLGAFTGFNIYLQKHISLGSEFSTSLLYNKIGGEYIMIKTYGNSPNPAGTIQNTTTSSLYTGFQFSRILSSFNISMWF